MGTMTAAAPTMPVLLDQHARPVASVTDCTGLTKDQRLWLSGGDLGFFVGASAAGKPVTMHSAMQLSAFWACVRRTAEAIASLPLDLYQRRADGGRVKSDDALAEVLTVSPNADQTGVEFWEGMVGWLCVRGNAYAEIDWYGDRVSSLTPHPSTHVKPVRSLDGVLSYVLTEPGGTRRPIAARDMLHLRGWGFGGDEGLSPVAFGVQSLGTALAAEETAGKMFGSGMQTSGVLKTNQRLSPAQRQQLQEVMSGYAGSNRAGKLMILEAGMDYQALTMNPEDAQMLESRRFAVEEICRWLGVPPIVIGHSADGQTMWGSGVEQIMQSWLTLGINPVLKKIEQRIAKSLIPARLRRTTYAEFNREALLQMDSAAKAAFLGAMATTGTMTANERRQKLNMERHPDPAADALFIQGAMAPIGQLAGAAPGERTE